MGSPRSQKHLPGRLHEHFPDHTKARQLPSFLKLGSAHNANINFPTRCPCHLRHQSTVVRMSQDLTAVICSLEFAHLRDIE